MRTVAASRQDQKQAKTYSRPTWQHPYKHIGEVKRSLHKGKRAESLQFQWCKRGPRQYVCRAVAKKACQFQTIFKLIKRTKTRQKDGKHEKGKLAKDSGSSPFLTTLFIPAQTNWAVSGFVRGSNAGPSDCSKAQGSKHGLCRALKECV